MWGKVVNTTNLNTNQDESIVFGSKGDMEEELIYKKESYDLVGCAYSVFNSMKYGHYELYYQRAYEDELTTRGFSYVRELKIRVTYKGKKVGSYSLDFLVADKIVVYVYRRIYTQLR